MKRAEHTGSVFGTTTYALALNSVFSTCGTLCSTAVRGESASGSLLSRMPGQAQLFSDLGMGK